MDLANLWQLHREGRDRELMQWARTVNPSSVPDAGLCELLGELFSGADQVEPAILWYRRADTDAARQALPLLYLRQGDADSARRLLASADAHGTEWHEANYLLRLIEKPTPIQRLDALGTLLDEQYLEPYMTEYAAVCFLAGQEKKGFHMAKKQLRLFPGGPCERQARSILEEGAAAAQAFLSQLEARRRPQSGQPDRASQPAAFENVPHRTLPEKPAVPARPLPEPVARCFDGVVGMSRARQVLLQLYDTTLFQKSRQDYQLDIHSHFHFLIRGAGGSGKTLLANHISGFLHELGAASDPAPCILESYQLNGYLAGNGSELTEALAQCGNRTVVVDGIGPLFDAADHGAPSVKLFYRLLEPFQENLNYILIGADEDIDRLLSLEPTAAGMFLYDIKLEPYSAKQLVEITGLIAAGKGYTLTDEAARCLEERLETERQTPSFQNGKTLEAIIDRAALGLAARIAQTDTVSKGKLMRIEARDLEAQAEECSLEELLDELNGLTGLAAVKERVRKLAAQAKINQEARRAGMRGTDFGTLHMIFTGNAGTGKTTVARIIGGIYRALGILPQGDKIVECGRSDLIGQYQGQTAPRVRAKVAEAMGGVLFIDEAYALCRDSLDTFGQEAVDTLVAEIENHRAGLMVILAGYPEDMDRFLEKNAGLASRFPNRLEFTDYTQEEMEQIFHGMLSAKEKRLDSGCEELLRDYIAGKRGSKGFGNARGVRNLLDQLIEIQNTRLVEEMERTGAFSPNAYKIITYEDLSKAAAGDASRGKSLQEWLDELNGLTGLALVKERVRKLAAQAKIHQEARRAGIRGMDFGTLHMIFTGNAGTGKTTVARIIGGIYCALGILPQGDKIVECTRSDLVGEYQGHTAMKVKQAIDSALGGVLFIDEACALCQGDQDSFGREAVNALIADMENHRRELMVILADDPEDMDRFLEKNARLASRFPNRLEFTDYTQEEMEQIFLGMLSAREKCLDSGCEELLRDYIAGIRGSKGFGNAWGARNLLDQLIEIQNTRLVEEMERTGAFSPNDYKIITYEDLSKAAAGDAPKGKSLQEWLDELNGLTGLASVKEQVQQKSKAILAQKKMAELHLGGSGDFGTLHMVFRGNAGTGKTTVARILGGIYNALGLLPSGDIFVECTRSDLVGEYQGHTAMKVKRVIDSALGGVLFIDEAYALCRDGQDSFGREAVDALIADMENHRKELMVILAGYSEDMDRFLAQNQGMASRVPTTLTFEDYTQEEMLQIFQGIVAKKGFTLPPDGMELARRLIAERSQAQGFGNARGVRNLAERMLDVHNARIGDILSRGGLPADEELITIIPEDFQGV